jgi:hypothetical protein
MSERRFSEQEVAEILKYAAESQHSEGNVLPVANGLTLSELTEIGREVGIAPEAMQLAARRFDRTDRSTRLFLGLPIGVGRTIELDRKLTDEEWDRLVADLRETFDAKGVVKTEGSLRSWSNGNLQALLEPGANGHRLRLRTVRGNAQAMIGGGIMMFAMSALLTAVAVVKGTVIDPGFITSVTLIGGMGIAAFGTGAIGLPGWARLRRRQMDEVAERLDASV